jgi:hypothetical protein
MRTLRRLWAGARGWWLVVLAAAGTAVLTSIGRIYTGALAAAGVAVGGAVGAVLADRGRVRLAEPKTSTAVSVFTARVNRIGDPLRLGVHPAASVAQGDGRVDQMPTFISRDRWPEVTAALVDASFVLIVGESTAGKTRLAYEAMRACLPDHVCVSPQHPDALRAALAAARQNRPSVLWLDDIERFVGLNGISRVDLDGLLELGSVVVMATLRAQERQRFSARHDRHAGGQDQHLIRSGREVLQSVTAEIRLELKWSDRELSSARAHDDDPRIAAAIAGADRHGIAETLAAGPQLLRDWQDAWSVTDDPATGGPRGAALVAAAVDVRRAGYHRPVSLELLRALHLDLLQARGGAALRPEPWETALQWALEPLHATSSLLEPADGTGFLAFDYLVDVTAADPAYPAVRDATWMAVVDHAEPADLVGVAWEAVRVGRVEHVARALDRAIRLQDYLAAAALAQCLGEGGQEVDAATALEAILSAENGALSPEDLLGIRSMLAWYVGETIVGRGDPGRALQLSQEIVHDADALLGDQHPTTLSAKITLARQLGATGDAVQALTIATRVADQADDDSIRLAARFEVAVWTRESAGPEAGARQFSALLQEAESSNPQEWDLIAACRWNLGSALLDAGNAADAADVLRAGLRLAIQTYGPDHDRTIQMRRTLAEAEQGLRDGTNS